MTDHRTVIKVAALDDQSIPLGQVQSSIDKYNLRNDEGIMVQFDAFQDPDEFIQAFNHDLALIDIELGHPNVNGFDVARDVYRKQSRSLIFMFSSNITKEDSERNESLLPKIIKSNFVSELVKRYQSMSVSLRTRIANKAEVFDEALVQTHVQSI